MQDRKDNRIKRIRDTVNEFQGIELGKLPPQAVDLEEAVLGAIMLESKSLKSVSPILTAESFYKESHAKIYQAAIDIHSKGEPIDILTVTTQLRKNGELELVGGPLYISSLTNRVASTANVETHARYIVQMAMKRESIRVGNTLVQQGYDETEDCFDVIETGLKSLSTILQTNVKGEITEAKESVIGILQEVADRKEGKVIGIPSSIISIRNKIGVFGETDMIVVGGSTSMGKTAYAISECLAMAQDGKPVVFFSLEMSKQQIVYRLLSQLAAVDLHDLVQGKLDELQEKALHNAIGQLERLKIFIDDTPALNVNDFRARCHKLKDKHNIKAVFIDYLQLMTSPAKGKNQSREQELSNISRTCKQVAKEIKCSVFALAQLSREVGKRKDTGYRPITSDIRECGSIEQDADIVLFPYRAHHYGVSGSKDNEAVMIVAKNRNGSLGDCRMSWVKHLAKYKSYSSDDELKDFTEAKSKYDSESTSPF